MTLSDISDIRISAFIFGIKHRNYDMSEFKDPKSPEAEKTRQDCYMDLVKATNDIFYKHYSTQPMSTHDAIFIFAPLTSFYMHHITERFPPDIRDQTHINAVSLFTDVFSKLMLK